MVHEGIWSLAIGLDNAVKRIAVKNDSGCEGLPGDLVPLEEFDYTNEKVGCILRQGFAEVNFYGFTVSFSLYIKQRVDYQSMNIYYKIIPILICCNGHMLCSVVILTA